MGVNLRGIQREKTWLKAKSSWYGTPGPGSPRGAPPFLLIHLALLHLRSIFHYSNVGLLPLAHLGFFSGWVCYPGCLSPGHSFSPPCPAHVCSTSAPLHASITSPGKLSLHLFTRLLCHPVFPLSRLLPFIFYLFNTHLCLKWLNVLFPVRPDF